VTKRFDLKQKHFAAVLSTLVQELLNPRPSPIQNDGPNLMKGGLTMRSEVATVVRYSLRSMHESWFRLTYEVGEGPQPGLERWFLVGMEEVSGLQKATESAYLTSSRVATSMPSARAQIAAAQLAAVAK
jgi:hypothetical protein